MGQTSGQHRYSREEVARRGDEIYEREVLPHLSPEDKGKLVLIDVESGNWEMDRDELAASDRLRARKPHAQLWIRRVGFQYVHHFSLRRMLTPVCPPKASTLSAMLDKIVGELRDAPVLSDEALSRAGIYADHP